MNMLLTLRLTDLQRERLSDDLAALGNVYADQNAASLAARKALYTQLEISQLTVLDRFRNEPDAPQLLLLDNLPTDAVLPATPISDAIPSKDTYIGEHMTLGLGALVGDPVGYIYEKQGNFVHNLVPIRSGESIQSNQSSRAFLNFHNDTVYDQSLAYNRFNPDFLTLYCVRQDPERAAETIGVDARNILSSLTEKHRKRAFEARFQMASPANYSKYQSDAGVVWSQPQTLFFGSYKNPEICLAANGVRAVYAEDESLLQEVYEACRHEANQLRVKLEPGQGLLINNRKGVHARSQFCARYDGNDRWLLRGNVRAHTWAMRHNIAEASNYKVFA